MKNIYKISLIVAVQFLNQTLFGQTISLTSGTSPEQKTRTGYDGVIIINLKMYNKDNVIKLIEKRQKGDD